MLAGELRAAAAANMAAWHTSCLNALHVASSSDQAMWSTDGAAPFIFLSGITLGGPEHTADYRARALALARRRPGGMGINDTWSSLDLAALGFERHEETWFVREPRPVSATPIIRETPSSGWVMAKSSVAPMSDATRTSPKNPQGGPL